MSLGGGGSGGGGSSGSITNEPYLSEWHADLLGDSSSAGGTGIYYNLVLTMNEYWAANPYVDLVAHSADSFVTDIGVVTNTLYNLAAVLNPVTDWQGYVAYVTSELDAHVLGDTNVEAAEAAYNDVLNAEYENVTLPRFQRGMQDANAVMSSAFVIGEALLEAELTRRKAAYSADLRLQNYKTRIEATISGLDNLVKLAGVEREFLKGSVATYVDARRIAYVAKKEEIDRNVELDTAEAKWDIDAYSYAGNFLAASHGGTSSAGNASRPSFAQSVLGGALSGASMGSSVYPGWGTVFGALGGAGFGIGQQIGYKLSK